ncbi:hypothetical protein [Sporosalibacterium faouarense]|uniref:hypothetical protein n=1 Tax=Sporosalibacterium faouarense TaxID=516123 RepID=UPI00192BC581|nr:hypothetical protein [Sporosalibacterium faouarense]
MRTLIGNTKRFIISLLVITLLIPLVITGLSAGGFNGDDLRIATEISNLTGVDINRVLELKSIRGSWNQVLDMLRSEKSRQKSKDKRSNGILQSSVSDKFVKKLIDEGNTEADVMDAKMLVEKVIYQLNEITNSVAETVSVSNAVIGEDGENNDIAQYVNLKNKIDMETAISVILKLQDKYDTIETALNEYLYSLQLDINLEDYINNQEKYEEEKEKKRMEINLTQIITLSEIESEVLAKIQRENEEQLSLGKSSLEAEGEPLENNLYNENLDVPNVSVEDVKPLNPTEELMNEIRVINPNEN